MRPPTHLASDVLRRRVLVRISTSGHPGWATGGVAGAVAGVVGGMAPVISGGSATTSGSGGPTGPASSVQSNNVIGALCPTGVSET